MKTVGATERMQRVLAILPWIAARDGPTIAEVCERFSLSEEQLLADLDVVWLVGLPPYTPEQLIDVVIEDGRLWIHYADYFAQPLRLTPEQGLALVAAGQGLLALPGADQAGPLARGLAKLAAALHIAPNEAISVDFGDAEREVLDVVQRAVGERRRLAIDYYSYGRDELTHRTVDPYRLHADEGALYLFAHCHLAGGERLFRLDRVQRASLLDETFDVPDDARSDDNIFRATREHPRVTLDLKPEASWVVDQYPVEDVRRIRRGNITRVTLAIAATRWLERLLLRLGPSATVSRATGAPDLADAGRRAAERVLRRYRDR
jgi:proteasome accessory factor C